MPMPIWCLAKLGTARTLLFPVYSAHDIIDGKYDTFTLDSFIPGLWLDMGSLKVLMISTNVRPASSHRAARTRTRIPLHPISGTWIITTSDYAPLWGLEQKLEKWFHSFILHLPSEQKKPPLQK
jgi:hypothetical protein